MTSTQRREEIKKLLENSISPLSASKIASEFSVSRQVIVGDIALLRAAGSNIYATPRGYIYEIDEQSSDFFEKNIACKHSDELIIDEIYTIVDNGAQLVNVIVEHSLYGQISAPLHITSRYDADEFIKNLKSSKSKPLCDLTDGIHLHGIKCPDKETAKRIEKQLNEKGILFTK